MINRRGRKGRRARKTKSSPLMTLIDFGVGKRQRQTQMRMAGNKKSGCALVI